MNELHKYATFSVDLLGQPRKINSMFSMGRARIFYKGINRNRSIIEGEVAEKLAMSIAGTPVIGTYNYETEDFEGHEPNAAAYGFVPLDPKMQWVKVPVEGNKEREYLEVDVVIWDGRFEEAKSILAEEKSLSMELNPKTMRGTFERIGSTTYYKVSYAEFAGITVLGDDVEPCFEDAQFITAYSNMVSAYALYIENLQENDKGGKDTMEEIIEIVEPEVATEEVVETVEVAEEIVEEAAEEVVEEVTEEVTEVVEATEVKEETEIETEVNEIEEVEEEVTETEIVETEEALEPIEFEAEAEEEVCDKCGKNPCVCESALDEEAEDDKEEDDKEEEEYKCNEEKYVLKADYDALEQKYNEALNSLNKYTKKEKLEIISKFSTKLESEELIAKLTSEVDSYTVAEIKAELGAALVEQISAEEDEAKTEEVETNFSLNIDLNNNELGNTAWDLVKRHKESK